MGAMFKWLQRFDLYTMEIRMKTSEIEAKGLLASEFAFISYNILPYKFYPSEFDLQILLILTGVTGRA